MQFKPIPGPHGLNSQALARWAQSHDAINSSTTQSLLTHFAIFLNPDNRIWWSVDALARATRLNRKTVQASLRELRDLGVIVDTGDRIRGAVVYALAIDQKFSLADPDQKRADPNIGQPENGPPDSPKTGHKELKNNKKNVCGDEPPDFIRFFAAYPKKTHRAAALTAWLGLDPDQLLVERILSAVTTQAQACVWALEGGRYIPNPASWLSGQRWDDVVPKSAGIKKHEKQQQQHTEYSEYSDELRRILCARAQPTASRR